MMFTACIVKSSDNEGGFLHTEIEAHKEFYYKQTECGWSKEVFFSELSIQWTAESLEITLNNVCSSALNKLFLEPDENQKVETLCLVVNGIFISACRHSSSLFFVLFLVLLLFLFFTWATYWHLFFAKKQYKNAWITYSI